MNPTWKKPVGELLRDMARELGVTYDELVAKSWLEVIALREAKRRGLEMAS